MSKLTVKRNIRIKRRLSVNPKTRADKGSWKIKYKVWPEDFREARAWMCLTRTKAAELLGVNVRTIKNWEAGLTRVPWAAWLVISRGVAWTGWRIRGEFLHQNGGYAHSWRDMQRLHWLAEWWRLTQDREYLASVFPEQHKALKVGMADGENCNPHRPTDKRVVSVR